jgi:hypothetical protein
LNFEEDDDAKTSLYGRPVTRVTSILKCNVPGAYFGLASPNLIASMAACVRSATESF